jgi:hypothetical protein
VPSLKIPRDRGRMSSRIFSDHTIIQCPDCLFRRSEQNAFRVMTAHVNLDDRLTILRAGDRFRKWNSLDDQRVCCVCQRKFKGRQIEIRRFPGGRYKLYCPTLGCPSGPHQWLYPRTSIGSEIDETDWWRADKQSVQPAESIPQTHSLRV